MIKKIKNNDFVWNALGVGLNSFNSLFFMIIVTRINGLSEAGIFSYAFALGCLFYYGSMFYNRPYQVANFKKFNLNSFLSTRIVTSLISIILILFFSILSGFSKYKIIVILLIFLYRIVESISDCFYGFIHAKNKLYFVGKSMFIKSLLGIIVFTIIDIFSKNIILSLLGLLLINLMILILYDLKEYYNYDKLKISLIEENVKIILASTFSIFIFSFLANFYYNMQKYILTYYVSDELQTIFGIIIMPATIMILGGSCLINPFINKLNEYKNKQEFKKFSALMFKIIGMLIMIAIVALFVFNYLGISVLNIIYNINLNNYKNLLLLVIFGSFFTAVVNVISGCLTLLDVNKEQLIIYSLLTILSLAVSIILIKNYFIKGAVYAFLISMVILSLLYFTLYIFTIKKQMSRKIILKERN